MTTKQQIIDYFDSTIKNYDTAVSRNKNVLGNTPAIKVTIENIETAMNFVIQLLDFPFQ